MQTAAYAAVESQDVSCDVCSVVDALSFVGDMEDVPESRVELLKAVAACYCTSVCWSLMPYCLRLTFVALCVDISA